MRKSAIQRRDERLRQRRYVRRSGNDLLVLLLVVVAVAGFGGWAFYTSMERKPELAQDVASGPGSVTEPVAGARSQGAMAPATRSTASAGSADARALAQDILPGGQLPKGAQLPEGMIQRGDLPEGAAAALSAGTAGMPGGARGTPASMDPNAVSVLREKMQQSQQGLEALGAAPAGPIPESDPEVLEQLPPEIRALYRARFRPAP